LALFARGGALSIRGPPGRFGEEQAQSMALVLGQALEAPQAAVGAFEDREQALVVRRVQRDIAGVDG